MRIALLTLAAADLAWHLRLRRVALQRFAPELLPITPERREAWNLAH